MPQQALEGVIAVACVHEGSTINTTKSSGQHDDNCVHTRVKCNTNTGSETVGIAVNRGGSAAMESIFTVKDPTLNRDRVPQLVSITANSEGQSHNGH